MRRCVLSLGLCSAMWGAQCREIEGDRVRASDLAQVIPGFAAADPARDLGPAPLAGVRRIFRPDEIARLARESGIALGAARTQVCLVRATVTLSEEMLLPRLIASLGVEGVQVRIVDFSRYAAAPGTIEFPRTSLSASGFWRGQVRHAEGRSTAIWARIRVTDATTGAPVSLALPGPANPGPKQVKRGDTVRVEVSSGGVQLAFDAPAESGGRVGDLVMVKNPANGRRFQARVDEKGRVSIQR